MTIQFIFNNQKWGDELKNLEKIKIRLIELTRGKIDFELLPTMYSSFKDLPFVVIPFPFSTELGESPDPVWFKNAVYPLNRDADALILVLTKKDWVDNKTVPGRPYGYCFSQYPVTAPPFVSVLAESDDKSWKFKNISAIEHYTTHELAHAFSNLCGIPDRTHELDYQGKIQELYDLFDYDKIKLVLKDKRKLDGQMANFYFKQGDPTGFVAVEGKLVGISTDDVNLKKDWPTAKFITLSPDEFLKFDLANFHTLSKRK